MKPKYELINNYREIIIDKICDINKITRDYLYFKIDRTNLYQYFDDELILKDNDINKNIIVNFEIKDLNLYNKIIKNETIEIKIKDIIANYGI